MLPSEKEFDRLFDAPTMKPPADFLDKVMRQVENSPSPLWQAAASQRVQANKQLKIVVLKLTKIAAFVFGIMLATAAV
jgi:hypothetical protein